MAQLGCSHVPYHVVSGILSIRIAHKCVLHCNAEFHETRRKVFRARTPVRHVVSTKSSNVIQSAETDVIVRMAISLYGMMPIDESLDSFGATFK